MKYSTSRDRSGSIRTISTKMGSVGVEKNKNMTEVGGYVKNPVTKKPLLGVSVARDRKKKKTHVSVGFSGKPAFNKSF